MKNKNAFTHLNVGTRCNIDFHRNVNVLASSGTWLPRYVDGFLRRTPRTFLRCRRRIMFFRCFRVCPSTGGSGLSTRGLGSSLSGRRCTRNVVVELRQRELRSVGDSQRRGTFLRSIQYILRNRNEFFI